uniref:Plastid lipid-associated protein/fibrillin conserved domain-containing protein n=1 Tax=Medicago truncatula TaxID=3880 RepID=I3T711_MEDTR|nr:unknown [Medicago truncatula]
MASLSNLNQLLHINTLPVTSLNSTPSITPSTITFGLQSKNARKSILVADGLRRVVYVRATANDDDDDEWGSEPSADVAVAEVIVPESETEKLKKDLVGSFYGTARGLKAASETRAEIFELISQLEAKNPTPASTDALSLLDGKWILAYTSYAGLFPLLSSGLLPLLEVEELSQTIDSESLSVQNSVLLAGPLTTTSISTNAKFEVRSPNRLQIKFEEGVIGTPQLTDSLEIPETVEFLGQEIDLSSFKDIFTSIQNTASSVVQTISDQPPLKIPISNSYAQSWLLTTYLDEELRVARGDGGGVFVLIKEGSSLLTN